jgi:DNA-binding response OmpR family regulator
MKILVADDDAVFLRLMERLLTPEYELVTAVDGQQAIDALQPDDGPMLAVLDWEMPRIDGLEICRRVRCFDRLIPIYLLLVTSRNDPADISAGFAAGADDYVTKPLYPDEIRARIGVGRRVLALQEKLATKIAHLENALTQVEQLEGLLPLCGWCRRIRDDENYWHQLDTYLSMRSQLKFTHGICPQCVENVRKERRSLADSETNQSI